MDIDTVLFDIIPGREAGEHFNVASVARTHIDVGDMN
jgi:hypothetical protein